MYTATPQTRKDLFVSHSADDVEGRLFLHDIFSRKDSVWRPIFYSVEGPKAPHANSILRHIAGSAALAVLLSPELACRPWTRSWVGFEVGVAAHRGLPILVIEPPTGPVVFPVPGVTHVARRAASSAGIGETFWAKVARADFLPVEDEPWVAGGEKLGVRALAFFYNLGLETRSVEGAFSEFECHNVSCRAKYAVEYGLLSGLFQCPSCCKQTGKPLIRLQFDLEKMPENASTKSR